MEQEDGQKLVKSQREGASSFPAVRFYVHARDSDCGRFDCAPS